MSVVTAPPYDSDMSSHDKTQDAPIMDGANEATEEEKQAGREDQIKADNARDGGLDDDLRSIRVVDEGKNRARTEGNGSGADGAVDISNESDVERSDSDD
ncbi:hypothetical protein ASF79_10555 [Agreia sp. Leaf335]|nr:hypothetical protein ASE64_10125 [Agreia sp. Leaf210]KQR20041.1 hypothetical protein ASF79_10555 [Agreia sp. Leaf335]